MQVSMNAFEDEMETGRPATNTTVFFTPADFRGFQTHLLYESKLFNKAPMFYVTYNLGERTDLLDICNSITAALGDGRFGEMVLECGATSKGIEYIENEDPADEDIVTAYADGVMLQLTFRNRYASIYIMTATKKQKEDVSALVENIISKLGPPIADHTNNFYMVTHNGRHLDLAEFEINTKKFHTFDLEACYNDDFLPVAERVESFINSDDESGIVLLHGVPGSGKTSFIRYLLTRCSRKRIIYLPPDLAHELAQPSFFNFIRRHENSVLLIEDAENILRKREGGGNQSISNLLNLSDGIMGDALRIQLVCTFNAEWADIDDALTRPGRLVASYHFSTLKPEKTKALVKKLHGDGVVPLEREMTLAEIYKMGEEKHKIDKQAKRKMGFAP